MSPVEELFGLLRIGRTLLAPVDEAVGGTGGKGQKETLCYGDFVRSFRQTGMMLIWTQLHQALGCDDANQVCFSLKW